MERLVVVEAEPMAQQRRGRCRDRSARTRGARSRAGDCGCARDCGGRWSEIRVVTASPAMARSAELKASGVGALKGEGGACGARSEGQGGGGPLRRKDRLSVARSAPAWQAVAAKGNGEGRGRGTDRRGSGRSPGRPSRWRSRGETISVPRCPQGRGARGRERDAMTVHALRVGGRHQRCGHREPCAGAERRAEGERGRCPQGRGKRTWRRREAPRRDARHGREVQIGEAMRGGRTAKRGEPLAAEAATGS